MTEAVLQNFTAEQHYMNMCVQQKCIFFKVHALGNSIWKLFIYQKLCAGKKVINSYF